MSLEGVSDIGLPGAKPGGPILKHRPGGRGRDERLNLQGLHMSFSSSLLCSSRLWRVQGRCGPEDSSSERRSLMSKEAPEYRRMEPLKRLFVAVGSICGAKAIRFLNAALNYLAVGHWMKVQGFHRVKRCGDRRELFRQMASRVAGKRVLYLEFGVSSGSSMRYWSELLENPASCLHGFDSFEGLPEDWIGEDKKGAYSTGGRPPAISDGRVRFFQGLFEETLPGYVWPSGFEAVIINIDCDLYSSTSFVLKTLEEHIGPGLFSILTSSAIAITNFALFTNFSPRAGSGSPLWPPPAPSRRFPSSAARRPPSRMEREGPPSLVLEIGTAPDRKEPPAVPAGILSRRRGPGRKKKTPHTSNTFP